MDGSVDTGCVGPGSCQRHAEQTEWEGETLVKVDGESQLEPGSVLLSQGKLGHLPPHGLPDLIPELVSRTTLCYSGWHC